jgi:two-component system, OmpR family, sensor histidine kinase KdpD
MLNWFAMNLNREMNKNNQTMLILESGGQKRQRILVSVCPSHSEQLVLSAHRLARALKCWWGVVYVETSAILSEQDQSNLSQTLALARSLGAEVMTMTDSDRVRGLLRTAIQSSVTRIIIAKQVWKSDRRIFRNDNWLNRLLQESGEFDIHVLSFKEEPPPNTSQAEQPGTSAQP